MDNYNYHKKLVNSLCNNRINNYIEWISLGICLYNISNTNKYLYLWINKSKENNNIDDIENKCKDIWLNFSNQSNISENILKYWSYEDNLSNS